MSILILSCSWILLSFLVGAFVGSAIHTFNPVDENDIND